MTVSECIKLRLKLYFWNKGYYKIENLYQLYIDPFADFFNLDYIDLDELAEEIFENERTRNYVCSLRDYYSIPDEELLDSLEDVKDVLSREEYETARKYLLEEYFIDGEYVIMYAGYSKYGEHLIKELLEAILNYEKYGGEDPLEEPIPVDEEEYDEGFDEKDESFKHKRRLYY